MKNMRIEDYNMDVKNWDVNRGDALEFLKLLTERNAYIQKQTPLIDFYPKFNEPSKNRAFIDYKFIKNFENVAFHVGFPHQKRLHSLIDKFTKNKSNLGVFFSLKPEDITYFPNFNAEPFLMVYLLDTGLAKDIRLQKKYTSSVISRYDLDEIFGTSRKKDKIHLKEIHKKLNNKWIKQNTILFNVKELKEYLKKGEDWLIVPDPIDINY